MTAVSQAEFRWRLWVLGEGEYREHGHRNPSVRPDVGYGGPGQRPIPRTWWQRLEAFLAERHDKTEPPRTGVDTPPKRIKRAPAGQLTAHFNVREFDCHDGRKVPAAAVPALTRLCKDVLEPLRVKYGSVLVMSGYRPADYNRRIGGAKFSQHIYELGPQSVAADLVFQRGRPSDWAGDARILLSHAGGVGEYPSFIHVDNRETVARWSG